SSPKARAPQSVVNALRKVVAACKDFDLQVIESIAVQFKARVSLVAGALHLGGRHRPSACDAFFSGCFHLIINTEANTESFRNTHWPVLSKDECCRDGGGSNCHHTGTMRHEPKRFGRHHNLRERVG